MDNLKLYATSVAELEKLVNTVQIFDTDISMNCELDKCPTLSMNRDNGIRLPNSSIIKG